MSFFIVHTHWMIHPHLHFLIYQTCLCPLPLFLLTYIWLDSRECWRLYPMLPQSQKWTVKRQLMLNKLVTISTKSLNDLHQMSLDFFQRRNQWLGRTSSTRQLYSLVQLELYFNIIYNTSKIVTKNTDHFFNHRWCFDKSFVLIRDFQKCDIVINFAIMQVQWFGNCFVPEKTRWDFNSILGLKAHVLFCHSHCPHYCICVHTTENDNNQIVYMPHVSLQEVVFSRGPQQIDRWTDGQPDR